jgi:hypothetical protein
MRNAKVTAGALIAAIALLSALTPAVAERRLGIEAHPEITVQSEIYPSQTVSGAVRRGPRGDEVRLPGGTWVPCGFNCYYTLRNATIDFWRRYDVFPQ